MAEGKSDTDSVDETNGGENATPAVRWVWLRFVEILVFAAFLLFLAFDHFDAAADKELISALLGWPFLFFVLLLVAGTFAGNRFLVMFESRKWSLSKDGISVDELVTQGEGMGLDLKELEARLAALEGGDRKALAGVGSDVTNGGSAPDVSGGGLPDGGGAGGGSGGGGSGASAPVAPPSLTDLPEILAAKSVEDVLGKLNVQRTDDGRFVVSEDGKGASLSDLIQQSAMQGAKQKWQPPDSLATRLQRALKNSRFEWRSIERLALECGVTTDQVHRELALRPDLFRIGKGKSLRAIAKLR